MDKLIYAVLHDPIDWLAKGLVRVNYLKWDQLDKYEQDGARALVKLLMVVGFVLYFSITKM
jgi:hypothetical protein